MICELCSKEFESARGLHSHLAKIHNTDQESYYHKFYPRYDKHSGDLIVYKEKDQYFESDFNCRENFVSWLTEKYRESEVITYCLKKLKNRLQKKNLTHLPTQIELKGLMIPTISGFEKMFGEIDAFFVELSIWGIKHRFDYKSTPVINRDDSIQIYVDTREQLPLDFDCPIVKMKLSVGDYTCAAPYYSDIFVERKSLADLAGTLGGGKDRFRKEIERSEELGFYLVIVVEAIFSEILNYSINPKFGKRVTGAHLTHEIRDIMSKHSNVQFVCASSRNRATILIENIFRLGGDARKFDLEYLKDKNLI